MKEFQEIEFAGWVVLVTQHRPEGEGNSEFSFLPQDAGLEGEFFHIGTYTRQLCHCRLICAIQVYYGGTDCYYPPGVLHVLLLGEFPKYADPNRLDLGGQIWLQERGVSSVLEFRKGVKMEKLYCHNINLMSNVVKTSLVTKQNSLTLLYAISRWLSIKYTHYRACLIFNLKIFLTFYIIKHISS